jgi:hypothetical protein
VVDRSGKLRETQHIGDGETIVGYVSWRYIDCFCRGPDKAHRRCGNTPIDKYRGCLEGTRVTFPSSPWACCAFCGKGGKIGSTRSGGVIDPHSHHSTIEPHSWGYVPKQVKEDEFDLLYGQYSQRDIHICHGCKRQLDNLREVFNECDELVRIIGKVKEQQPNAESTEEERTTGTAVVDQDNTRSENISGANLRGLAGEADHNERCSFTSACCESNSRYYQDRTGSSPI